MENQYQN